MSSSSSFEARHIACELPAAWPRFSNTSTAAWSSSFGRGDDVQELGGATHHRVPRRISRPLLVTQNWFRKHLLKQGAVCFFCGFLEVMRFHQSLFVTLLCSEPSSSTSLLGLDTKEWIDCPCPLSSHQACSLMAHKSI